MKCYYIATTYDRPPHTFTLYKGNQTMHNAQGQNNYYSYLKNTHKSPKQRLDNMV